MKKAVFRATSPRKGVWADPHCEIRRPATRAESGDESVSGRLHGHSRHEYCRAAKAVGSVCGRLGWVCTGHRGEMIVLRPPAILCRQQLWQAAAHQ
eukprot:6194316-Prymnesium_polylepis.1